MIVKAESEIGIKNILINGNYAEILNVTQFDTETKEAVIALHDKSGQPIINVDRKITTVRVVIPAAKLREV